VNERSRSLLEPLAADEIADHYVDEVGTSTWGKAVARPIENRSTDASGGRY
jgi:hypothetical protein